MFRIKICGLTNVDDVDGVVRAGVDAIGLNFYPPSKRFVTLDRAAEIASRLPPEVARVGVFVNAPVEEIVAARDHCALDYVQLHGDESPNDVCDISKTLGTQTKLLRAFRLRENPELEITPYLDACRALGVEFAAILVDAHQPGHFGGTGATTDWDALCRWTTRPGIPLILAGGLTAENVATGIAAARADGVDTAGGVENSPGRKDAERSQRFVAAANAAYPA